MGSNKEESREKDIFLLHPKIRVIINEKENASKQAGLLKTIRIFPIRASIRVYCTPLDEDEIRKRS